MHILISILFSYLSLTTLAIADILPTSSPECRMVKELYYDIDCKEGNETCRDRKLQCRYGARWESIKDFYAEFQEAMRANDKHRLAEIMPYPFTVYAQWRDLTHRSSKIYKIKDKQEFLSLYTRIFPKYIREDIVEAAEYDKLYVFNRVTSMGPYHKMEYLPRCRAQDPTDDLETCPGYHIALGFTYYFNSGEVNADFTKRKRPSKSNRSSSRMP